MTKPTLYDQLLQHLDASAGIHALIARETGVPQTSISRIYRREAVPTLTNADKLLQWFASPKGQRMIEKVKNGQV